MRPGPPLSPRVKYRHWIFRLPFVRRYRGIVLGRTIAFQRDAAEVPASLLRHETVHQEQMDRHTVLGFYLIYLKDYLRNLWRYRDHDKAYRNVPFEIEAYERENDVT